MRMARQIHAHIAGISVRFERLWLIVVGVLVAITASSFAPVESAQLDVLIWYAAAGAAVIACVASLFMHELAHVWAATKLGDRIGRMDPSMFGGLTDDSYHPHNPRSDALVASAGPLISFAVSGALGAVWLLVRGSGDTLPLMIAVVALANLTLGVTNLLPAFPLDGGRILRAFVWYLTDDLSTGARIVSLYGSFIALMGLITGGVLVALGNPLSVWGAWMVLCFWAIHREGRAGSARTMLREASREMTIDEAGLANSSRVQANRSIDDAIDDLLTGSVDGPLLVADEQREIIGIVSLGQLRQIPREQWPTRFVREVCSGLESMPRIGSDETILALLQMFDVTDAELILIVTRGRITGAVDPHATYERVRRRLAEERRERRRRGA